MLTAQALYPALESVGLEGALPLQVRILLRAGLLLDSGEIGDILSSGRLSASDDVSEAYDVILGRW